MKMMLEPKSYSTYFEINSHFDIGWCISEYLANVLFKFHFYSRMLVYLLLKGNALLSLNPFVVYQNNNYYYGAYKEYNNANLYQNG
jgi:hypothetical protein